MNTNFIDNRQIRIFISSTFSDMTNEREYLMNFIFPELKKMAAERDVTLIGIDLRWGITEEESQTGKVVEICFREIENSIPFFIGIIGHRYGWVPKNTDLSGDVGKRYSEVNKYVEQHLSITEMEMQFGVLARDEDMHAYFYIKEQNDYDVQTLSDESEESLHKLEELKTAVQDSKYPSSTYRSSKDLGAQVKKAFINLLDELFPQKKLSDLEKIRFAQRSFKNQLCQQYIKDDRYFEHLDSWMEDDDNRCLVITGDSGIGKSALIANWLDYKLRDDKFKYNIIYHFTGNGGSESSCDYISKAIKDEIIDIYQWNINDKEDIELEDLFEKVSKEESNPLLIVIDAINQIVNDYYAKQLTWFPTPKRGIKIICSTLEEDNTMDIFKNRSYDIFKIHPLKIVQRTELVHRYLNDFGKTLTSDQVNRIVGSPLCKNTLVLRTLLEELVNFGVYEKVTERIEYFLSSDSIDEFYQRFLMSYEDKFKNYNKNFVRDVLSLIAVSKYGLNESEIMAITSTKQLEWSMLYCSLFNIFCNKNGKLSFCHTAIRASVESRYHLNIAKYSRQYREMILEYCIDKLDCLSCFRELPYQLFQIGTKKSAEALFEFVKSPSVSATLYNWDKMLCIDYWRFLRKHKFTFNCFERLKDELIQDDDYEWQQYMVFDLRRLLTHFGEYTKAFSIAQAQLSAWETSPNVPPHIMVRTYNACANESLNISENFNTKSSDKYYLSALNYYIKAIELSRKFSLPELSTSYNGMARACILGKWYDKALILAKKAVELGLKQYGRYDEETGVYYNTLANVHHVLGNYYEEIKCMQEVVGIINTLYGKDSEQLIIANFNLADSLYCAKRYDEALKAINLSINIIKAIYGNDYFDMDSYVELKRYILEHIEQ